MPLLFLSAWPRRVWHLAFTCLYWAELLYLLLRVKFCLILLILILIYDRWMAFYWLIHSFYLIILTSKAIVIDCIIFITINQWSLEDTFFRVHLVLNTSAHAAFNIIFPLWERWYIFKFVPLNTCFLLFVYWINLFFL